MTSRKPPSEPVLDPSAPLNGFDFSNAKKPPPQPSDRSVLVDMLRLATREFANAAAEQAGEAMREAAGPRVIIDTEGVEVS